MSMSTLPSVAFGEGRRPEAATRVVLPAFDGPLALLLSLIEARQLDVLTVPLGALADAYLDALATLDEDRMGHVSAFVAVASQLILIKSRAMLPRRSAEGPVALTDEGPDPEAELRARLILYRAFRDAGTRLLDGAAARYGLFHREPTAAHAAGVAGARPPAAEPLSPALLVLALDGLARIAPPPAPPPETIRRTVTLTSRAAIIREALRGAPAVVLQDLLRRCPRPGRHRGHVPRPARADEAPRDRRRAGRAVGADRRPPDDPRRARRVGSRRRGRRGRPARRVAGVVRMTELETAGPDEAARARRGAGSDESPEAAQPAGELTEAQLEALLFVAEKPLSRREIGLLAGVDRATVDARLGDLEVALAGRGIRLILSGEHVELTTAPEAGALIARYVGADAVRLSPAALETLAIVAYRQPVTRATIERVRGVDSDYTVRALLHRRLIVEQGRSDAPGRPYLYGTGFEFLERFGLTSLEELPILDLDVATRLVDEAEAEAAGADESGGTPVMAPLDDGDGEP